MIRGRVIGSVWSTRKSPRLAGSRLLLVAEEQSAGGRTFSTGRVVVCHDELDAREGDPVVVAFGSGARNAVEPGSRDCLVDAAVVQIVDGNT